MTITGDRPLVATSNALSRRRIAGHRPRAGTALSASARPLQVQRSTVVERVTALPVQAPEVDWPRRWERRMLTAGLSPRTIEERLRIVRAVAAQSGRAAHLLDEDDVAAYLISVPAQNSRSTYWAAMAAWHLWLRGEGARVDDPMARLPRPRTPQRTPRPVSTGQLRAVLASQMHARTRAMILLAALAGLRVHEVAKVRGSDFDLLGQTLTVLGKGGRTDVLPLHPTLASEARLWPSGLWFPSYADPSKPILPTSVSRTVSSAMQRAGVRGTAHQLRHWFGTELLSRGADTRTVQTLMRHASLNTTALYTEVADSRRAAAVERLPQNLVSGLDSLW